MTKQFVHILNYQEKIPFLFFILTLKLRDCHLTLGRYATKHLYIYHSVTMSTTKSMEKRHVKPSVTEYQIQNHLSSIYEMKKKKITLSLINQLSLQWTCQITDLSNSHCLNIKRRKTRH